NVASGRWKLNGRKYTASNVPVSTTANATPGKLARALPLPWTSTSITPSTNSIPLTTARPTRLPGPGSPLGLSRTTVLPSSAAALASALRSFQVLPSLTRATSGVTTLSSAPTRAQVRSTARSEVQGPRFMATSRGWGVNGVDATPVMRDGCPERVVVMRHPTAYADEREGILHR